MQSKQTFLVFLSQHQGTYDLIFADPPYALEKEEFNQIVDRIFENKLLQVDNEEHYEGMLVIEHSKHTDLSDHQRFDNQRKYGGTVFSFFR